ncbi:MAG: division/cell wall cluster transcriptional repressor MraZ [Elusimicrobia bacterium]|nr:division/cell wall cluster transcriptional repressor MraZ [Elusimicrobiota bacterium]
MGISVLIGKYDYTLDDKNRLVVPPKFRKLLEQEKGSHFFLAKNVDGCLSLFLPSQWEGHLMKFDEAAKTQKNATAIRAAKRDLFNTAEEALVDEQGRILVPESLKEQAHLRKDVIVAGAGDKAEIWDAQRYERHMAKQAKPAFEKVAKELAF